MDYKKYSLENLENWLHDAMSAGEATPQEIYDVIVNVVKDEYYTYKKKTSEAYEFLTLLNNNPFSEEVKELGKLWDKEDVEAILKEREYYEPSMPPWGHSDMEALRYTEEEMNAMCDKASSDEEKEKCREYNLREAEYYNQRAELDLQQNDVFNNVFNSRREDKVVKWKLPVDIDGLTGDAVVNLPDDLLERAGLKEGDVVEWIDRKDGSFEMKKVIVDYTEI